MAFVPTPNTVRVIFQFAYGESIVEVTIAITKATAWTGADFDDLMPELQTWWDTELKPYMTGAIALTNIKATDISSETGTVRELPIVPPIAGTGDAATLPANAAYVTTFNTPLRGRSYRGRAYLPGIPQNKRVGAQDVDPTWAANVIAAFSYINSYLEVGWFHAVVSLFHDLFPRVTGVATPITSYAGDFHIDSQRRRLAGRGI
jgi:hypothetical protein